MRTFVLLALVAVASCADVFRAGKMAREINMMRSTWKAGINAKFEGMPKKDIRKLMGVIMDEEQRLHAQLPVQTNEDITNDIPETFDARTAWPDCADVIGNIRDQSACGSCWAVAAASAMSDRICISSKGANKASVSSADLMACCSSCGYGCEGGFLSAAWSFFQRTGIVTGGNYTSKSGCKPYPFPNCEHHNTHTTYPACPTTLYDTPPCKHECQTGYPKKYDEDKIKSKSSYSVPKSIEAIQKEIMTYGSIEASFTVYEDFLSYTSGVYQHMKGGYEGGHAVKMIGWGTENGTPYWQMVNSWNADWGDHGFFKIIRGKNDCGIEAGLVAGLIA